MATINQMGIPNISNSILMPMLKNRWRVTFIGIGAAGSASQNLSQQAISVSRPKLTFEEVKLHRYNSRAYVAGPHEWEPCNIVFESDVTGTAAQLINDQVSKQQWLIGAEGPFLGTAPEGSIYKFAMKIEMLDGHEQSIERWVLQGCWFKEVDYDELEYSGTEAVQIKCVVRFDHAYQEIGGYNAGGGIALGGQGA